MARKRLNVKFLVLGLGPVLLLATGLVAWRVVPRFFPKTRWLIHGKPEEHASKAKAFFDQGKYQDAADAYKYALFLKAEADAPMFTALADSYSHLILKSDENGKLAIQFYEQALGTDPRYVPALERMLEWRAGEADLSTGPRGVSAWEGVALTAQKILAVDPTHRKAQTAVHRATLAKWRLGAETPAQQVDDAMAALIALATADPFDAESVFYVMQGMMTRVQQRLNANDTRGKDEEIDKVLALVKDALDKYPNDALLHFRSALAYRGMGMARRSGNQPPAYQEETERELKLASNLIKPDHPMYTEIRLFYGKMLEASPQTIGEAEQVYRSMLSAQPTELAVRVALAELLSRNPNTQLEAVTLLEQAPPPDLSRYSGVKAYLARRFEFTALYDIINIKLDMLPRIRNTPGGDAMLKQIEDAYAKLIAIPNVADGPLALQSRGRLELARNQNTQAVQTLERAMKVMPSTVTNGPDIEARYRLMFFLSGAYVLTGQTGEAKTLLTTIVNEVPSLANGRLMLAQLLLQENKPEEARVHVDKLQQLMPGDPRVLRLAMRCLDKDKDKDKLLELYQKLPEKTPEEIGEKALAAIYIERREDAAKLLEGLRATRPQDVSVRVNLANVYNDMGDKTKALAIMDEALKLFPDSPELKLQRARLAGDDMAEVRQDIIDKIADPLQKAVLQYELAIQEDRPEDAKKFLATAISLNPNHGRVIELMYNRAVIQRDWTTAHEMVEKLAKANHDGVDGMLYRVRYHLAKGELDQAANNANALVQRMPEFAPSYVVLGQVQKAQKKYPDAVQNFETALKKASREITAIRELIEISYITNNPTEARRYIADARRLFPNVTAFREQELAYELKYGDPAKVIEPRLEMLKVAIEKKDPTEVRQWVNLGNAYLAVARSKDTPQAGRPFLEKARDNFDQAIKKFPDEMILTDLYSSTQLQLKAVPDGERAIMTLRDREAWKNKPEPTVLLASYYSRAGDAAKQEKVLRDYLVGAPASVPVQLDLSMILARQNKLDEAMKLLEVNADQPEIRRQRIELQINADRLEDAEREIRTAIAATSTPSSMLLNRQAFVYMKSKRVPDAMTVLERSLAQNPTDMEALFLQGSIYLSRRNTPQAIANLQAARDNHFKELESRLLLAQAYRFNGDLEAATRELEETVRLFPEDKTARLNLLETYERAPIPNWVQAERMIRDARNQPKLANDPQIASAEAEMWLQRKQPARAAQLLVTAMQAKPDDMGLFQTYLRAIFEAKDNLNIIRVTDAMVQAKKAPWWVYMYRGKARKELGDRNAAQTEFQNGMDVAWAANDEGGTTTILNALAQDIGVPAARTRIMSAAEQKGGYRWQLMMSYLYALENDFETAITWAEKVVNDPAVTPDYLASGRRQLGGLYLRSAPPKVGKAVSVYRELIKAEPDDIVSLNNLASAMILPNSGYTPREAMEFSERAYKLLADKKQVNSYIYDTHGNVLVLGGRLQDGIKILLQAMDEEPIPELCLHVAEAYLGLATPRVTEAQDVLKQGLALIETATREGKPVDPEVKSKIEKALQQADQIAAGRGRARANTSN